METMTISQAIRKVKDIKGRIAKHQGYAVGSVLYALKSPPAYSFKGQLELSDQLSRDLLRLTTAIAFANATTFVEWGGQKVRLAWAIRRLEEIKGKISWFESLPVAAQPESAIETWEYQAVGERTERVKVIEKQKCELPEAERNAVVQKLQDEFNSLNDVVETINHRTNVSLDG